MKHSIYTSEKGRLEILNHYEQYLNSFDFEVERAFVDTSIGKTHVLMAGPKEGKPLFIFQGGNCINPMTLSWFKPLIKNIEYMRLTRLVTQDIVSKREFQLRILALGNG
ncbi:hypothetical protein [Lysinibacillus sp. NPDC093216]|uniref:hypothetical protein n=1 Tax=Lysinibacillus sp. NPDC093216 TaxID=3390576 RepID=UPI003CFC5758